MKNVLCVGSVTTDILMQTVDKFPQPGTLQAVDNISIHVGGCASNTAIDLAKLGVATKLSCKVGNDYFGEFIIKNIKQQGIDISGIVVDTDVATTLSNVFINSSGERSFLYHPGSTAEFTARDISPEYIQWADIVFVAGAMLLKSFDGIPCATFLKECRKLGKFTVMDTAWDYEDKWGEKIEVVYSYLDLFMPSYEEASRLSRETDVEKIVNYFLDLGTSNVIIKLGKDGAYFCEKNGDRYYLPTYRMLEPVDTTGAGDSFCAGFLAGLTQGWDFRQSGKFANAVGAHCIMQVGASTGIKSIEDTLAFMKQREDK